jgi:cryptochrome
VPNFDKMLGNPICKQIPWRRYKDISTLTHKVSPSKHCLCTHVSLCLYAYAYVWYRDEAMLAAWKEGRTGYPFIDAIMTQLREEGWIHHLARHAVSRQKTHR